jgi:hypothetical protein
MTVALTSNAGDVLTANTSGTAISQSWNGTNLALTGSDSVANYQQVLRTIQYNNTLTGPGVGSETATFTALDAHGGVSAAAVTTITITGNSSLTNKFLFYKGSTRFDTTGNARAPLAFSDDNAIALDKSAYVPNGPTPATTTAVMANFSSYSRGVNGIMVDLKGGGQHASITLAGILSDFTFKVGNNSSPGTWANAPNPTVVTVRTGMTGPAQGAGTVSGSDRVELIWADNAIEQKWLEVIVKATANTGLAANSVFFYGNEIGNTGSFNLSTVARTGSSDIGGTQTHGANLDDFDRTGKVDTTDIGLAQTHGTSASTGLKLLVVGSTGPFAPDALPSASPSLSIPGIPSSILNKLGDLASSTGPLAKYLTNLAHQGTAQAQTLLQEADSLAHLLGANTSFIDSLLAKITSALPSASPSFSLPSIPSSLLNRLSSLNLDLNSGPIAKFFEKLAHEGTDGAKKILTIADEIADFLHLDDTLLDSLLVNLGIPDSDA